MTVKTANPAGSAFDIQVNVDTIDTHNEGRDKHLKSPEFFDAAKYPTIAFKSKSVKKTGESTFEATGDLTLHGETRPLTVKIERTGAGPGMKGEHRSALETTFDIKRSEFGMKTMIGPLGDDVRLNVSIEGVRE